MVVRRLPPSRQSSSGGGPPRSLSLLRCFRSGLGCGFRRPPSLQLVSSPLLALFHQPARAVGHPLCGPGVSASPPRSVCGPVFGQFYGPGLPQEAGGTRSSSLNAVDQELLRLCESQSVRLIPQFIPGHLNVLADSLSRRSQVLGSKWTLCPEAVSELLRRWPATIDLYATSLNHRLPVYFSPTYNPLSAGTDAMLQSWDGLQAHAFPPFSLLPRVLAKVRVSRGLELTLVAPFWPQHHWFPDLLELPWRSPSSCHEGGIFSDNPTFITSTRTSPCFS